MRIGELAQRTRVPARLLRYYEEQGLLSPYRAQNGYRIYGENSVARVQQIRGLLEVGLSTRTIRAFLPCLGQRGGNTLAPNCVTPEVSRALKEEAAKIQARIDSLTRSRDALNIYLTAIYSYRPDGAVPSAKPGNVPNIP
ncbi:MerR family transcriptional regulator [Streptomyces kronopolitis]|uniref:MerR family transcriptional regulator n=1 Tax=Streptomyces kronopolitis TaxID=1612435 RepID=UPI0036B996FD